MQHLHKLVIHPVYFGWLNIQIKQERRWFVGNWVSLIYEAAEKRDSYLHEFDQDSVGMWKWNLEGNYSG